MKPGIKIMGSTVSTGRLLLTWAVIWSLADQQRSRAGENLPQKPFAQSVWLPHDGQFVVTPWYQYSEFFHIWRGRKQESIETDPGHDGHGFDLNDGILFLDYGIATNWAADLALGYTSAATRAFDPNGNPRT